jgi:oligopeptide transport system substrate-binding protein
MKRVALLSFLACSVASLLVVGCGQGGFSQRAAQSQGNVFRYPIPNRPSTLDPGIVQDGDTIDLIQQVYEGLVTWGEDNEVKPLLAERWDVEDGGRTYVFHLKRGVKFHNGREVTADDFKWSFERNTNPNFPSQTAEAYLEDIVGVREKIAGKAREIRGVQVVDPYTLRIQIDEPRPYFLGKLTYIVSAVMPKESAPEDQPISNIEQMVGTGPFRASSYAPDQLVVLEAFDEYHGGRPPVDKIERPILTDAATRLNKYRGGELDLIFLQRQDIEAVQADSNLATHLDYADRPAIFYVGLNSRAYAPFGDRRVRRAFAMAIDRTRIVDEVLGGNVQRADGIVPPGVFGHREAPYPIPYDPEGAAKLLAEAGFADGRGLPPLEMRFRADVRDISLVAEAVQSQLKRNLNVDVDLRPTEWGAYLELDNQGKNGFFHMRWMADYLDAQNFLSHMLATWGPENNIGYRNEEFDRLCREADTSLDRDLRLRNYAEAEQIVLNDAPWIPIYYQRDVALVNPRVQGLRESLFGYLPHTRVSIKQ